jgi:uncharacterized membrane protein
MAKKKKSKRNKTGKAKNTGGFTIAKTTLVLLVLLIAAILISIWKAAARRQKIEQTKEEIERATSELERRKASLKRQQDYYNKLKAYIARLDRRYRRILAAFRVTSVTALVVLTWLLTKTGEKKQTAMAGEKEMFASASEYLATGGLLLCLVYILFFLFGKNVFTIPELLSFSNEWIKRVVYRKYLNPENRYVKNDLLREFFEKKVNVQENRIEELKADLMAMEAEMSEEPMEPLKADFTLGNNDEGSNA